MFVELNAGSVKNVINPAKKCQAMTKEIAFLSKSCCQELKRREAVLGVNFINVKRTNFWCENSFWQLLLLTCN
jgi:hypothetical protein